MSKSRPKNRFKNLSQLIVYALAELLGGFTFSLLSPFYTKEATAKGLSVSETGLVMFNLLKNTLFILFPLMAEGRVHLVEVDITI